MLEITLPWFDSKLSPNNRAHWSIGYKPRKIQKEAAYWLTKEALHKNISFERKEAYLLGITFYPPDKKRRDRDNNLASIKLAIDGIAQALDIDDSNFDYSGIKKGEPVKNGKIVVIVV